MSCIVPYVGQLPPLYSLTTLPRSSFLSTACDLAASLPMPLYSLSPCCPLELHRTASPRLGFQTNQPALPSIITSLSPTTPQALQHQYQYHRLPNMTERSFNCLCGENRLMRPSLSKSKLVKLLQPSRRESRQQEEFLSLPTYGRLTFTLPASTIKLH